LIRDVKRQYSIFGAAFLKQRFTSMLNADRPALAGLHPLMDGIYYHHPRFMLQYILRGMRE
jgi:hypothetical protein